MEVKGWRQVIRTWLRVASYRLQVNPLRLTTYDLRKEGLRTEEMNKKMMEGWKINKVGGCKLQVEGSRFQVTG